MKAVLWAGVASVALASAPAIGQTAPMTSTAAAKAFGAREYIQDISLAPDGSKVAMVMPDSGRGATLAIADFASGKPPQVIMRTSGSPDRLSSCRWVTSARLICSVYFIDTSGLVPIGFTRLVAVDADGKNLKMVSARTNDRSLGISSYGGDIIDWTGDGKGDGSVMMMDVAVPEQTLGTNLASTNEGLGVDLVDTSTLRHRLVESAKRTANTYITDGIGHVRILSTLSSGTSGYMGDTLTYSFRKAGERGFQPLGVYKIGAVGGRGLLPVAVDPALDSAYAFDDQGGRRVLVRIKLDDSKRREVVVSNPDYDVDDLIQIGRQQRVVGASWAGEKREAEYFDPELKALSAALGRALPKKPIVGFVDASADEKQLLLYAGSDDDPGRYYLFDKASKKLEEVMTARPQLAAVPLATMTPITFKAADGTAIPGYLTLPPGSTGKGLPAIVMPHGGPGARDEWDFNWLVQFYANRGFAVLQPNFRGSSGYGEAWFEKNGFQSWRIAVGDVNDGARWLIAQGIAAPDKLAIVGWSYGGYAALQSPTLDPTLFRAIVAIAPVTDLDMLRNESRMMANFPIVDRQIGSGPHLKEGSPARNAAAITAPVLLFHGDIDRNVGVAESRLMADRLKDSGKSVEYVEFKGLDHQIEDSAARAQMLEKSDAFLRKALKM